MTDHLLKKIRHVVLDLDGTLYRGGRLFPATRPFLDADAARLLEAAERLAARRADIDFKQQLVATLLAEMNCEALLLLMPAHVAWFTSGRNSPGKH